MLHKPMIKTSIAVLTLAMLGALAAILALALCFVALYLWLELELGIFAALGILGGTSALLAAVLFAIAFLRGPRKPRARTEAALRAAADPAQTSTAAIARAADEAVSGAADIVRNGSRQQIVSTIAVAAFVGWVLGRRL